MRHSVSPTMRWSRALLLAGVCLMAGSAAHLMGGGLLPGSRAWVFLTVSLTVICALFLGVRASRLRLVALTVGGQGLVHVFLAATAGHIGDPVRVAKVAPTPVFVQDSSSASGSYFDQFSMLSHQPPAQLVMPAWAVHMFAELTGPMAPMAVAHLIAAAAVGLWLARGEAALWELVTLLFSVAWELIRPRSLVRVFVPQNVPGRFGAPSLSRGVTGRWAAATRRGPPVGVFATP